MEPAADVYEPSVGDQDPPRVVLYQDGDAHQVWFHNTQAIAERIGPPIFAAFLKCFNAVDRATALHHLIYLNNRAENGPDDPASDTHAYTRNAMVLGFLITGTMYEVGEALQDLLNSRVAADPELRAEWEPIDKLRAEWFQAEDAKEFRHNFSHHLGWRDRYEQGAAKLDRDAVFFEAEKSRRFSGRHLAPWDALILGNGTTPERFIAEFKAIVDKTHKAHLALPELLSPFFGKVLEARGVSVTMEKGSRPSNRATYRTLLR